jgi:hypothetical protein
MLATIKPIEGSDTWLRHLIFRQEACPNKKNECGIWHYTITKSLRNGALEISGRALSLISDGIQNAAERQAARFDNAHFKGIVYQRISIVLESIGAVYEIVPDPIAPPDPNADNAHTYLRHLGPGKGEQIIVSAETLRMHNVFAYAPPGSDQLRRLERLCGIPS